MSTNLPADVVSGCVAIANRERIEPAALMCFVEVEGAGKQWQESADHTWPRFLFERHKFYANLKKLAPNLLTKAMDQGLAHSDWRRTTQYLDQNTSAGRVGLLRKAITIHREAALRSASWGIGQIMGDNAMSLDFANADAMVSFMRNGGITAHFDCMVRFIKSRGLVKALNAHQWTTLARSYNGAGYAQNQYDTKMRLAYPGWRDRLDPSKPEITTTPPIETIADLPDLRMEPVPEHMGRSDIGNGALLTAATGATGVVSTLWEQMSALPDSLLHAVTSAMGKPWFWGCLIVVAAGGYIYYSRYVKLRDAET